MESSNGTKSAAAKGCGLSQPGLTCSERIMLLRRHARLRTERLAAVDNPSLWACPGTIEPGTGSKMMKEAARRLAWRVGRSLYCRARGDGTDDPRRNGEYWLVDLVIQNAPAGGVLLNVGASVGEWTGRALEAIGSRRDRFRIHAFEPCAGTIETLRRRFASEESIEAHAIAVSSSNGDALFFSGGGGLGTNSLDPISGSSRARVPVTTLDTFLSKAGIEKVLMLKCDVEGFDLGVMRGASSLVARGKVDVLQFEYNWRWLRTSTSLLDVFELIKDYPYRFGKLARDHVAFYDSWHFELDRYFENNYVHYVLVRKGCALEACGRSIRFDSSNVAVRIA